MWPSGRAHFCSSKGFSKSCRPSIWQRFALWFVIMFSGFRIGEASHPGPFTVGTVNPTGLMGKLPQLCELPKGLWGVTETHLTNKGLAHFRSEMSHQQRKFNYSASSSAPYLRTTMGAIGGKATGVGVLSDFPCRSLPECWPDHLRQAGRAHASAVFVQNTWIRIGVCYGYAKSPHNLETKQKTDEQLALLTQRIVHESTGPRVICGDFNQLYGQLPQEREWAANGFVEIQQWAYQRWNLQVQHTCKNNTVKDFAWISPELLPFLESVHLDHELFADHSALWATFRDFARPLQVQVWPKPKPLPWEQCDADTLQDQAEKFPAPSSPTAASIFSCLENRVHSAQQSSNKPGLLPTQRGRCTVSEPKRCPIPLVPLKKSRQGELTPQFVGEHFQHARWLKQARRLQSLVKLLSASTHTPQRVEHAGALWTSILQAHGFPKGFRHFWAMSCSKPVGAPAALPHAVPSSQVVNAISAGFWAVFSQFESILIAHRTQQAKQTRVDCPTRIFQDVARPRAVAVQTLLQKQVAHVTYVNDNATSVNYEPQTFHVSEPVMSTGQLLQVSTHEAGTLNFDTPQSLVPGDILTQQHLVGDQNEVLKSFEKMWVGFWGRHEQAPAEQWTPFIDLCHEVLDPVTPMEDLPITVPQWMHAANKKKSRAAVGPDGITKLDLTQMPLDLVTTLVDMINDIEAGRPWPTQWIEGHIHALAKRDDSSDVGDYRPICVFRLVYRVWGTIRSRQILSHLARIAPDELTGSRPHKETAHVWWQVANMVESSFYDEDGGQVTGALADLTKCFNCLPRIPVLALARLLGLPKGVCIAWHNALLHMRRRFIVTGSVGAALPSSCGFPEGCAMSVVSMFMINIVYTRWMHIQNPTLRAWSFVDDWQITAPTCAVAVQGLQSMQAFTLLLDLSIDLDKSFLWSTSAEARSHLRALAHRVKLYDRNLGGHLSYCKVHSNFTLQTRLKQLDQFWTWLSRSVAPLNQKLTCLTVVAWPRSLHGVAGVILGKEHYQKLRTKALQSVGIHRKGMNPKLVLSAFLHPRHDPEFYALLTTVKAFRKFCIPDNAFPLMDWLSSQPLNHLWPGPCGVFLQRMHSVGCAWEGNGWITDHEGLRWHILSSPIQVVVTRIQAAWVASVGSELQQRPGFFGLADIDQQQSGRDLASWDGESLGLLRVAMSGAFYTRDWLCKMGNTPTSSCPWCGEADSIFHRTWVCEHFQASRDMMSPATFVALEQSPECTQLHGWLTEVPHARQFRALLQQLQDLTFDFLLPWPGTDPIHLFTDGSCLYPERPHIRLATWGFVVANFSDDSFYPMGQGPVVGLHQTVIRAEFTACISALQFALTKKVHTILWSDNQEVVDFVQHCLQGGGTVSSMDKDHDLKERVRQLISDFQTATIQLQVVKVTSHVAPDLGYDSVERWALRGNHAADRCAEQAREGFSTSFLTLWEDMCKAVFVQDDFRRDLHGHMVRVGHLAVADKQKVLLHTDNAWDDYVPAQDTIPSTLIDLPAEWPHELMPKHGGFEPGVWEWFVNLVSPDEGGVQWVSTYQLLLDFQLTTGRVGFYKNQRTRQWYEITDWEAEQDYDFLRTAGGLASYLKSLFKKHGCIVEPENRQPGGISFRKWLRCIRVHISPMRLAAIDALLANSKITPIKDVRVAFKSFARVRRPVT